MQAPATKQEYQHSRLSTCLSACRRNTVSWVVGTELAPSAVTVYLKEQGTRERSITRDDIDDVSNSHLHRATRDINEHEHRRQTIDGRRKDDFITHGSNLMPTEVGVRNPKRRSR